MNLPKNSVRSSPMTLGTHMQSEIISQAEVLRTNVPRYAESLDWLGGEQFELVLLAARGSSDHAALFARYLLEIELGLPVVLAAPSVFTKFGASVRYPRTLAIGISQSGAAPDVAEVLTALRAAGHTTLAITNTAGSRITDAAERSLLLEAGEERSVAATKTYTASLAALYQVVHQLKPQIGPLCLPSPDWIAECKDHAEQALGAVLRSNTIFSLGRGFSFCSAHETALKLMECALIACKAYSTADFSHGPRALAGHGSAAISFGEPPEGLVEQGCIPIVAPVFAGGPSAAIGEIIFGQWLALLAARARGLNPDDPRFITKVTLTH